VRKAHSWALAFLRYFLLIASLSKPPFDFMLARGVLALVLALARVILAGGALVRGVLFLLGVVGDEVVGVSTAIASILRTTTVPAIQAVIMKP
jgi:hypothetical protein